VKNIKSFTLFIVILICVSCASNRKIDDMKGFINETVQLTEEFIIHISESTNESEIVYAIESFTKSITLLEEKSSAIKKKYPDIDTWFDEPPAELADDLNRLHIAERKFEEILRSDKVRELRRDFKVQSAFKDLLDELDRVKFFQ